MRLAVLWSEATRRAHAEAAVARGEVYAGVHLGRPYHWLRGAHAYLGPSGARHWLWRLGVPHVVVDEAWLSASAVEEEVDALVVPEAMELEDRAVGRLAAVAERGRCWLVIGGGTNLPDEVIGVLTRAAYVPSGYVVASDGSDPGLPVSPPGYALDRARPAPGTEAFGTLTEIDSEGRGPGRGLGTPLLFRRRRTLWLPAPLFEYLGGLIQGQADWWPFRERLGREAFGYVDRVCEALAGWLAGAGARALFDLRVPPWGRRRHAVVLRHDSDDSGDSTFWQMERADSRAATYPVLTDHRARAWVARLRETPAAEVALHYRTNRDGLVERLRLRFLGRVPRADVAAATQNGLLRQVREARPLLGRVTTLHRHYHYVHYPELLLALETLAEAEPEVAGAGSFARFQLARWGGRDRVTIEHPHVGVPFWFPIRPVVATVERHATLALWESAAFIEPDLGQIEYCLASAERLPGGCYTWVFHPAHAAGSRFAPRGTLPTFRAALDRLDEGWWVATSAEVYARVRRWSVLEVRRSAAGLELFNGGPEALDEVVVRAPEGTFLVARLAPGQAVRMPAGAAV